MRVDFQTWLDVVLETEEYIIKLIRACDSISEILYGQVADDDWQIFGQLIEGFENLYKSLLITQEDAQDHAPLLQRELAPLLERFPQLFVALRDEMETGQLVALADLVKYEWPALLADTANTLKEKLHDGQHASK